MQKHKKDPVGKQEIQKMKQWLKGKSYKQKDLDLVPENDTITAEEVIAILVSSCKQFQKKVV